MLSSFILLFALEFQSVFAQRLGTTDNSISAKATGAPNTPNTNDPKSPGDQVKVHVVKVGANGQQKFEPNKLTAEVGDMVQFQFASGNHTVAQSTFDQPCTPISMVDSKVTGFYSGFMPVSAASEMTPIYTIMISNNKAAWIYCAQGQHCQKGMTMVINENVAANATRSLSNFNALAAKSVTVQMKADGGSRTENPLIPSGIPSKPSGAPPKAGDRGGSKDAGPGGPTVSNPDKADTPVSSGMRTSISISCLLGSIVLVLFI